MKHTIIASILLTATVAASPRALREHVDIHWTYDEVDGWTCLAKTEADGDDVFEELDEVYLPIDDAPSESNGQRYIQPEGETYAFTGVAPGDPIWIASQIQQAGQCWPGFNNYQATGVFGAYQETDIRLSEADRSLALPWIKVTLEEVAYQGEGGGSFALWQEDSSGNPTVWFSTGDNTHPDTYLFAAGGHQHLFWGFGSPGIYQIRLRASAYLDPGQTNPTDPSNIFTVTFAVGNFARWQTENFERSRLDDPSFSGPDADPDHDGMKNIVEFAFGFDPNNGSSQPVGNGLGLPKLSVVGEGGVFCESLAYPRRRAGGQISPLIYQPQFASDLPGDWQDAGIDTTTQDFPVGMEALNAEWEMATSRRAVGTVPPARGFARVAVGFGGQP